MNFGKNALILYIDDSHVSLKRPFIDKAEGRRFNKGVVGDIGHI